MDDVSRSLNEVKTTGKFFLTIMTAKIFFGNLCRFIFYYYLCTRLNRKNAQMAESVDALVSNTSGAIHPGSSPGLGTI